MAKRKPIVLEKKIQQKMFGQVKDEKTDKWRIKINDELEGLCQKQNVLDSIQNRKLQLTGHAWWNQNPNLCMIMEENEKQNDSLDASI